MIFFRMLFSVKSMYVLCGLLLAGILNTSALAQGAGGIVYTDIQVTTMGTRQQAELAFEVIRLTGAGQPQQFEVFRQLLDPQTGKLLAEERQNLANMQVNRVNNTFYTSFELNPFAVPEATLKVTIKDLLSQESTTVETAVAKPNPQVDFALRNLQACCQSNFVVKGDSIMMQGDSEDQIFLLRFNDSFFPAPPPMGNDYAASSPVLNIDSVLLLNTGQVFTLQQKGLYFAQKDTTSALGLGFRVTESDYPKFKKVENVAKSMIYISSDEEIQAMLQADNKKAVLDQFWLNAGGSVENASRLIRTYYQRVAYANQNFTNYKEGWKTDRGIVYIVFGRPDEVNRLQSGERWVYRETGGRKAVAFDFMKRTNIFTGQHYELVRSPRYRRIWNDAVEMWRKGEI